MKEKKRDPGEGGEKFISTTGGKNGLQKEGG